ncbi:hypothetical protein LCGC14_1121400 [marine sediment metagenome]|uniref:10 kDa chaperonin n=1 Tax=marine sediment metagenome TaxID=412755 RepID=A0A0F9PLY9_9ZZZZ
MNVFPVRDRLLLIRCRQEELSKVIVIPDSVEKVQIPEFIIYRVGQGTFNRQTGEFNPSRHKEGDRVWLSSYTGTEFPTIKGLEESIIVIREEDVLMSDNPIFNTNSGKE